MLVEHFIKFYNHILTLTTYIVIFPAGFALQPNVKEFALHYHVYTTKKQSKESIIPNIYLFRYNYFTASKFSCLTATIFKCF